NTAPPASPAPPEKSVPHTSPTQPLKSYAENQDNTSPPSPIAPHATTDVPLRPGQKTNVLFHPTPTISLEGNEVIKALEKKARRVCLGIFFGVGVLLPVLLSKGGFTVPRLLLASAAGMVLACAVWIWCRSVLDQARSIDWSTERQRGEVAAANLIPESAEWLNTLVGVAWRLVNPDMFAGVVDMLEDVMQASAPKQVVENVRVADVSQGSTPLRLLSLRSLPDHHVEDLRQQGDALKVEGKDEEQVKAEEASGEWYNLEASFAYHADPTSQKPKGHSGAVEKAKNMHLLVVFYIGVRGLFGVPIPIWVELKGLVVTARIRLQVLPEAPYLGQLTFTLMGVPQVEVACLPMSRDQKGLNVLDLPMVASFVDSAVQTVASEYVAPKSMTLDMRKILEGDDIKKETESLGVVVVRVMRAEGLSRQDRSGGGCDAYVTLGWSKFGKPMYSTRVIVGDLSPRWEEVGFLLVKPENVKAEENLSVELWDSDRFTSDDMVGKVEVPLRALMQRPGTMHPQETQRLSGLKHDSAMPGTLHWEVGYFAKTRAFRAALRTERAEGKRLAGPAGEGLPELEDPQGSLDTAVEDAVMHTPPDPAWPQGVLSIIVHQCVGLEVKSLKGTFARGGRRAGREWEPGMANVGELGEEEGGGLPSAYATIALNDQLVYRTRTKAVTSKPIFNAGTERFVRDWRSAHATVCVRDSRLREHDPILGVVPLRVADLLRTASQATRWFPLDAGVGFGRVRVSVLFRSVEMALPRELAGWDGGGFFHRRRRGSAADRVVAGALRLRTGGSVAKASRRAAQTYTDDTTGDECVRWETLTPSGEQALQLPVKHRYMSPLVIAVLKRSKSRGHRPRAYCVLWLPTIADHVPARISLPIYTTSNPARLTHNFFPFDSPTLPSDFPDLDLVKVGQVTFTVTFIPGMCPAHKCFALTNDDRELFEAWEAAVDEGIRGRNGEEGRAIEGETVQRLQREGVKEDLQHVQAAGGVDSLGAEERQRLTDRWGGDWEGVLERAQREFGTLASERERRDSGYSAVSGGSHDQGEVFTPSTPTHSRPCSLSDSEESDTTESYSDEDLETPHPTGPSASDAGEEQRSRNPIARYREHQRNLHRRHQGLMQWKPIRTLAFAKDEVGVGMRKVRGKIGLAGGVGKKDEGMGRKPDVETEV
ncbi:hypothetical protein BDZ91DRAFT_841556, partial [Kalaharituber pfeilii]